MKLILSKKQKGIIVWALVILGVLTLVPINTGLPNHIGYYSICSSAPLSTIMTFGLAQVLSFHWKQKRKLLVYAGIVLVLITAGFLGYWIYAYKWPFSNLDAKIVIDSVWSGNQSLFGNMTNISFHMTFSNPTDRDVTFWLENYDFSINSTKLKRNMYEDVLWGWGWNGDRVSQLITVRAHQTVSTITCFLRFYRNWTNEDSFDPTLLTLMTQNFTLSINGLFVNRWPSPPTEYQSTPVDSTLIVAARQFEMSAVHQAILP